MREKARHGSIPFPTSRGSIYSCQLVPCSVRNYLVPFMTKNFGCVTKQHKNADEPAVSAHSPWFEPPWRMTFALSITCTHTHILLFRKTDMVHAKSQGARAAKRKREGLVNWASRCARAVTRLTLTSFWQGPVPWRGEHCDRERSLKQRRFVCGNTGRAEPAG